jgi:hypothetical protein
MTFHKATTDFSNFQALERWMSMELSKDMIGTQLNVTPASSTDLVLRFELPTSTRFGVLRINIATVLRLLPALKGYCGITLSDPNTTAESSVRVQWGKLQRAVFLLLSDIIDQRPQEANQPLPQIWLDGHGTILRATYPATATSDDFFFSPDYDVREETELCGEGYERIRKIERLYPYQYFWLHSKPDSLIRIWMLLRNAHWLDWESRNKKVKRGCKSIIQVCEEGH